MADANSPAREAILSNIRAKLGVRGDEPGRRGLVESRLRSPQPVLIPARARQSRGELIKLFQTLLEKQGAKAVRIRSLKGLSEAVAKILRDSNLPSRIRVGEDPVFDALKAGPGLLELCIGAADATDRVSLSHALAGAAESGTLILASGPENPSTLNFLPETHIVVIQANNICGAYEDAWNKLRAAYEGRMPRTVSFISGPSRTADIEQTIVQGAHGPQNLIVIIAGA